MRRSYLHMRVWWTEGRRWKTWLLTARLCSKRNGSSTTPSLTGNVSRSSSLGLAEWEGKKQRVNFELSLVKSHNQGDGYYPVLRRN